MNPVERIRHMEQLLNETSAAVRALGEALERYDALLPAIRELTAYYESPQWMRDFEEDCAGNLPGDLKRGVLSEDAIYNLLADIQSLHERYGLKKTL